MKRRLIALMLVLITLCPMVLAGCGGTNADETATEDGKTTVRDTVSLTMWVVTDEKTTKEAQDAVEEAFNVITKSTFTTYVDLVFYTKDQYEAELEKKLADIDDRIANGASKKPESTVTGEQYFVNELGVSELKYPDIYENQVDIVYIAGREQLNSLVEAGRLVKLNESISNTSAAKILNDVIPQEFFTHTKLGPDGKDTYAIPNNRIVGDYTYLLVHKDLVTGDANGDGQISADEIKGTYQNFSSISTFFDCEDIIEYVKANRTDMIPILSKFDNPYIHYWSEDGSFSLLASRTDPAFDYKMNKDNTILNIKNVFTEKYFQNFELLMKKYELENYFAKDKDAALEAKNFGVAVLKGDTSVVDKYSDKYYIKAIANPELNDNNLFTSFYGITNYTLNFDRALEIIVMLNTNSELRNTLQYGVEGVHYEVDEDGRVERFNDSYIMDINTTGNVFIAYPEEDMPDDAWERGVAANLNIQVGRLTGYWKYESRIEDKIYDDLAAASKKYKDEMDACKTVEELERFFDGVEDSVESASARVNKEEAYKAAISRDSETSIYRTYRDWYEKYWPAPAGEA